MWAISDLHFFKYFTVKTNIKILIMNIQIQNNNNLTTVNDKVTKKQIINQ